MWGARKGPAPDPRPRHAACSIISVPTNQHRQARPCSGTRRPATLPQGLRPAQQSLRSRDFLHLRNMKKGPAALLHPAQPPQLRTLPLPPAASGTARPVWGPAHPIARPVVHESLASTKHRDHCVPALVTFFFLRSRVCMFFGSETILFSVTDQ